MEGKVPYEMMFQAGSKVHCEMMMMMMMQGKVPFEMMISDARCTDPCEKMMMMISDGKQSSS